MRLDHAGEGLQPLAEEKRVLVLLPVQDADRAERLPASHGGLPCDGWLSSLDRLLDRLFRETGRPVATVLRAGADLCLMAPGCRSTFSTGLPACGSRPCRAGSAGTTTGPASSPAVRPSGSPHSSGETRGVSAQTRANLAFVPIYSMQYPAVTQPPPSDNWTIVSHVARIVTDRIAAHEPQLDRTLEQNRLR